MSICVLILTLGKSVRQECIKIEKQHWISIGIVNTKIFRKGSFMSMNMRKWMENFDESRENLD